MTLCGFCISTETESQPRRISAGGTYKGEYYGLHKCNNSGNSTGFNGVSAGVRLGTSFGGSAYYGLVWGNGAHTVDSAAPGNACGGVRGVLEDYSGNDKGIFPYVRGYFHGEVFVAWDEFQPQNGVYGDNRYADIGSRVFLQGLLYGAPGGRRHYL